MKTLTFFSNYFNHHQKALCDEWYHILGDDFTFVETEPIEEFRADMGWGSETPPSYVLKSHTDDVNKDKALILGLESDLVIIGSAPELFIERRIKENKLTFRYTERPLKEGFIKFFIPRLMKKYLKLHIMNRNKNLYVLGASAYAAADYKKMGCYKGKCYKFGYFPKVLHYNVDELMEKKQTSVIKILWMGRMLKLKRADLLIRAVKMLKDKGYIFEVEIIGDGEEKNRLLKLTEDYRLSDTITFSGFLSPEEAREKMAKANIYAMTSNFWEGWGSVIYEGLNAGCAVVASHACGSTPWLIQDGINGLIFQSGSVQSLADKLELLLKDSKQIKQLGSKGYAQIAEVWNPQSAAVNVLHLAECLKNGQDMDIQEGPCSKAEELKNNWYKY